MVYGISSLSSCIVFSVWNLFRIKLMNREADHIKLRDFIIVELVGVALYIEHMT